MLATRIAVSGKLRSGKDTLADFLMKRYNFVRVSFADKLYEVAKDLFGMVGKDRRLLQDLGRKMCEIDKLVWAKYALDAMPLTTDIVISDLRFPAEYHLLKAHGFFLVRIEIDMETQMQRLNKDEPGTDLALLTDPSETLLDAGYGWDYMLDGAVSFKEFYNAVGDMLIVAREFCRDW